MSLEVAGHRASARHTTEFSELYAAGEESAAINVAIDALASGARFDPPFECVWWLADELRQRRHFGLALVLVDIAQKNGYRGWRVLYLRGLFLALTRKVEPAIELLEQAAAVAPSGENRKIRLLRARMLAAVGRDEEALQCFRENLGFDEDTSRFADVAIRVAVRCDDEELPVRWIKKANNAYGPTVFRSLLLADMYFSKGKWQKARKAAEQGLLLDEENLSLLRLIARTFYHERLLVLAIQALERQLKIDPDWTEGRVLLSRSLMAGGRRREALAVVKKIKGKAAKESEVRQLLAELDDTDGAVADSGDGGVKRRRARKVDPLQDPEVQHRLANIPAEFVPSWTQEGIAASGNNLKALRALVHSVRTIMLRETMARFGRHELGYLWAIFEPLMHVTVLSFIFYFIRMRDTLGMNVVLFVATGVIPLFFYLKTFSILTNALKQNRPLLNHPGVQPMDIFLARSILEFFTQLFVLLLFVGVIYVAFEEYRFGSTLSVLANLFGLWIIGIGAGLLVGSLVVFAESITNIVNGFNRLVYITSGVFFTLDRMPAAVAEYATYNPLLHFVDGVRGNFNPLMGGTRVDIVYGFWWAFGILALGLVADRALRHKVLDR